MGEGRGDVTRTAITLWMSIGGWEIHVHVMREGFNTPLIKDAEGGRGMEERERGREREREGGREGVMKGGEDSPLGHHL